MKITEKQLLIMLRVLEGTLTICDGKDTNLFGYAMQDRIDLYNAIVNQQSHVCGRIWTHEDECYAAQN
jgi:hypothetical protein